MKIDALVIARSGSKGLYKKSTILIGSKPLIEYTLEAASGVPSIRNIYLSTDDAGLQERYKAYKNLKLIRRPKSLSGDDISIKDVVRHALRFMMKPAPEMVAVLSPTAPFRTAKHITEAIKFAQSLDNFDSVVSVTRMRTYPFGGLMLDKDRRAKAIVTGAFKYPNRQDQPPLYRLNRAIWLIRTKQISKLNSLLMSGGSYAFEMDEASGVDIDTQDDVVVAEAMLSFNKRRLSWNERGRYNVQRFYVHDDLKMGILRNAFDAAAYERHFGRYKFFLKYIKPHDSVLDIACGSGYGSQILAAKARFVYGVDSDAVTIEYAKRHYMGANVQFGVSAIENFVPRKRYDKVISVETIEHLTDPEAFLAIVKDWLKPQGQLWLTCPLSEDSRVQKENPFHITNFTRASLRVLVRCHFNKVNILNFPSKEIFSKDTLDNKVNYVIVKAESIKF